MAAAFSQHRPVPRIASASELVNKGSFASPLAQLSLSGSLASSSASSSRPAETVPPVPPLDLNLFRTPSVYSINSVASLSTISADEHAFSQQPESPTTPRADGLQVDYFPLGRSVSPPRNAHTAAAPLTPKRSFLVTSRPGEAVSPTKAHFDYNLRAKVGRTKNAGHTIEPHHPEATEVTVELESYHGEQGMDWGDDEAQFEWVDTDNAPEAPNGDGRDASPSKRLGGRIRAAVGGEGKKLRKNLVFPRRAPPPPPGDTSKSQPTTPGSALCPEPSLFAPQQPPRPGKVSFPASYPARPKLAARWTDEVVSHSPEPSHRHPSNHTLRPSPVPVNVPTMVPMRDDDGPNSNLLRSDSARYSQMSLQSVAYSFYDLDSTGSSTPRAITPTPRREESTQPTREMAFPHGKYTKVSVSRLERENDIRERSASDPTARSRPSPTLARSPAMSSDEPFNPPPDALVAKGVEARGKGDLPKSAWYFMRAAECGSSTGRMYWGLSLRHGWGVARDDQRAFAELLQACDTSLAEGGLNFHQSPGTVELTVQQKKVLTRDLSLGMFEIANCFLEGVGAKKAPEVALSYLRFAGNLGDLAAQEQLGFLLSKGFNGIKKDMKEAAKWYRMAIGQGSTNTFGLAWVWKDKYM